MKLSRRQVMALSAASAAMAGFGAQAKMFAGEAQAAPAMAQEPSPEMRMEWRNWSGYRTCLPELRWAPADEAELASRIAELPGPIRAVGAGHSFSNIVPTDGTLLTLDRLSGLISTSPTHARFHAGTRLYQAAQALSEYDRAMMIMPDINKQTYAGAISTATHGTGLDRQALPAYVTGLRLVTVGGEVLECNANQNVEVFEAARVSLGSIGVLTEIETEVQPFHRLKKEEWFAPLDEVMDAAPDMAATHRHWEAYYFPYTGMGMNVVNNITEDPIDRDTSRNDNDDIMELRTFEGLTHWIPPVRRWLSRQLMSDVGSTVEVDDYWKMLSSEQRSVRFNEMEYHVPADVGPACFREVIAAIEQARVRVFFPFEFRYIKGDDLWLSPFSGGDRCSIAIHRYFEEDPEPIQAVVEPIFRRYGGRPHWGKMNNLSAPDLAALYPHWEEFNVVRRELDPEGRLLTPAMRQVLGA